MEVIETARLHEHAGRVAIKFYTPEGSEEIRTVYISPALAKSLSTELSIASQQVGNGYHYSTITVGRKDNLDV